jgi:hypothetical protein
MKRKMRRFEMGGPTSYADSGSAGGSDVTFNQAFKAARAVAKREGRNPDDEEFTWKGKKYKAELASEKKEADDDEGEETKRTSSGPTRRGGNRTPTVTVTAKRDEDTPGRRFQGMYGETREALSSLSPEQKKAALAAGIGTAASMGGAGVVGAAGAAGRTGTVGMRGMTLAQRERDAAAAAEYAKRMKRLKETAEARSRMGRGATYSHGGKVHKYAGGGSVSSASRRADGIAKKGKTRGKIC